MNAFQIATVAFDLLVVRLAGCTCQHALNAISYSWFPFRLASPFTTHQPNAISAALETKSRSSRRNDVVSLNVSPSLYLRLTLTVNHDSPLSDSFFHIAAWIPFPTEIRFTGSFAMLPPCATCARCLSFACRPSCFAHDQLLVKEQSEPKWTQTACSLPYRYNRCLHRVCPIRQHVERQVVARTPSRENAADIGLLTLANFLESAHVFEVVLDFIKLELSKYSATVQFKCSKQNTGGNDFPSSWLEHHLS